jgi:hypothetical protein
MPTQKKENVNGLTFQKWLDAAGRDFESSSALMQNELRRAWKNGEDPAEWRIAPKE